MSEGLERLKSMGAQKIYEETHIPIEHVQAIIHESFDGFSKVQFLGFVSILEREYQEDLSELKEHGLQNFDSERSISESKGIFIVPKKKKTLAPFYILLAIIVFAVVAYFNSPMSEEKTQAPELDNSIIESAQKYSEPIEANKTLTLINDENKSISETNVTEEEPTVTPPVVEEKITKSLAFVAKKKLWMGYIDSKTNIHYNKIFTGEFTLDPEKSWLIVFGHGYFDLVLNGEVMKFNSKNRVRFFYKNGKIKQITLAEFKKFNRGRSW